MSLRNTLTLLSHFLIL